MPRLKKPSSEKLNDSINVPVNRGLKRRVLRVAKALGLRSHTSLSRDYISNGVEQHEKQLPAQVVAAK